MGDRANVKIIDSEGGELYLYTHYNGFEWPKRLKDALDFAKDRWGDDSYVTRCLITEMYKDLTGTTGGGVSTYLGDNSYPICVVDTRSETVSFEGYSDSWTFAEFPGEYPADSEDY